MPLLSRSVLQVLQLLQASPPHYWAVLSVPRKRAAAECGPALVLDGRYCEQGRASAMPGPCPPAAAPAAPRGVAPLGLDARAISAPDRSRPNLHDPCAPHRRAVPCVAGHPAGLWQMVLRIVASLLSRLLLLMSWVTRAIARCTRILTCATISLVSRAEASSELVKVCNDIYGCTHSPKIC